MMIKWRANCPTPTKGVAQPIFPQSSCHTVDGRDAANHLGCILNPVNNGANYQPQQLQDFFHQQYHPQCQVPHVTAVAWHTALHAGPGLRWRPSKKKAFVPRNVLMRRVQGVDATVKFLAIPA